MADHKKTATVYLIIVLLVAGIGMMSIRDLAMKEESIPTGDSSWLLNIRADFSTNTPKTTLYLSPPHSTPFAHVFSQNFIHPNLSVRKPTTGKTQKRNISIIAQEPGSYYLDVEFKLHFSSVARWSSPPDIMPLSAEHREKYLTEEEGIQVNDIYLKNTLKVLTEEHTDKNMLLNRIFDFVYNSISMSRHNRNNDAISTIRSAQGTTLGRAHTMIALCRAGNLPARLVTGFVFQHPVSNKPHHWVEVYIDGQWQPFDPLNGHAGSLPPSYIPMNKIKPAIIMTTADEQLKNLVVKYELSQQQLPPGMLKGHEKRVSDIFELSRLSLSMQTTLATLFLLPLGALFTTFTRNFLGIRSYGTFTPTLLALAAVYTDWFTAVMIFSLIAIFGVAGRFVLADSKITRVTRLSIVFTLAAISMSLGVSILDYFQLVTEGHVVLLPIVILTTLVDRIYTVADETGIRNSIIRLGWTVFVGLGCFLILIQEHIGYFFLQHPEAHFITIAMMLMTTLYKGRKFTDFRYITWLTETRDKKTSSED